MKNAPPPLFILHPSALSPQPSALILTATWAMNPRPPPENEETLGGHRGSTRLDQEIQQPVNHCEQHGHKRQENRGHLEEPPVFGFWSAGCIGGQAVRTSPVRVIA